MTAEQLEELNLLGQWVVAEERLMSTLTAMRDTITHELQMNFLNSDVGKDKPKPPFQ